MPKNELQVCSGFYNNGNKEFSGTYIMYIWMENIKNIELDLDNFGILMWKWNLKAWIKMGLWSQKNFGILRERVFLVIP